MRRRFPRLSIDAQRLQAGFRIARQAFELAAAVDPGPKYSGTVSIRKPAELADRDRNGRPRFDATQSRFSFVQSRFGPLADELQRDVKIVNRAPVQVRE